VPNLIGCGFGLLAALSMYLWMPATSKGKSGPVDAVGEKPRSIGRVICAWPMPVLIFLRALQGCVCFAFFEVVPLWAISTRSLGGLELSEDDLGTVLSFSAIGTAVFMVFIMPRMTTSLGLRASSTASGLVGGAVFAAMSWAPNTIWLIASHSLVNCCINVMGAAYIAFINNAAPTGQRGTVNGISVTFEACAKGAGPMSAAIAFAWTLEQWGSAGHSAVFLCLAFMMFTLAGGTACMPELVENRKAGSKGEKLSHTPKPSPKLIGSGSEGTEAADAIKKPTASKPKTGGGKSKAQKGEEDQLVRSVDSEVSMSTRASTGDLESPCAAESPAGRPTKSSSRFQLLKPSED